MLAKYVLSVSSQRKYNFYHQNTFLDAFQTNSRNIIGRNASMVIPLLANQDLTPMLAFLMLALFQVLVTTCALSFTKLSPPPPNVKLSATVAEYSPTYQYQLFKRFKLDNL